MIRFVVDQKHGQQHGDAAAERGDKQKHRFPNTPLTADRLDFIGYCQNDGKQTDCRKIEEKQIHKRMIQLKKWMPMTVSIGLLLILVLINANTRRTQPVMSTSVQTTAAPTTEPALEDASEEEMRGVWVTYMELSMENEDDKSEKAFRSKFETIAKTCSQKGFNTLIVQVRPFSDALYPSKLYPWSHILTGTQGKDPGYDPLRVICDVCEKHKLHLHAWINPYRVKASMTPEQFDKNNIYRTNPELCVETDSGIILDPSEADARRLIVGGVKEIIGNYPVDGIQFDDYFYPDDMKDTDAEKYEAYAASVKVGEAMDPDTWRKFNVNLLISEVYIAIHKADAHAVFGVSPQGNIENNAELYADVVSWCCVRGFVDYICPQLYYSMEHPMLTFPDALDSWLKLHISDNVRLYGGLGGYKAGSDADSGTWLHKDDVLLQEYKLLQESDKVDGMMLYSYSCLVDSRSKKETDNLVKGFKQS